MGTTQLAIHRNHGIQSHPEAAAADTSPPEKRQPLRPSAGLNEITRLELITPQANHLSPEFAALVRAGLVQLRQGPEHVALLGFDGSPREDREISVPSCPGFSLVAAAGY